MDINKSLNSIKDMMDDIMQSSDYRKARLDITSRAKMEEKIASCAGEFNRCKVELQRIVRHESELWREAEQYGFGNENQDALVWEAALKYMLVEEAIFTLNLFNDYEKMKLTCQKITNLIAQMDGAGACWGVFRGVEKTPKPLVADMFAEKTISAKSRYLNEFFDNVLDTGDIAGCLKEERKAGHVRARENVPVDEEPEVQEPADNEVGPTTLDPEEFSDAAGTKNDETDDEGPRIIDSRPPDYD